MVNNMKKISVIFVKDEIENLIERTKDYELNLKQRENTYSVIGSVDEVAKFLDKECGWCKQLNVDLNQLQKMLLEAMNIPFSRVRSY